MVMCESLVRCLPVCCGEQLFVCVGVSLACIVLLIEEQSICGLLCRSCGMLLFTAVDTLANDHFDCVGTISLQIFNASDLRCTLGCFWGLK